MKRAFTMSSLVFVALLLLAGGCRSGSGDLSNADTQRRFGVSMAKMDLWREAMFRFKRATEIEPDNAMAHNNLAVAYEAVGDFDAAAREYREALRLDRSNQYIQKNYSRFVEFSQRSKKREASAPRSASAAPAPPAAPPASAAAAPAPQEGTTVSSGPPPSPAPTSAAPAATPAAPPTTPEAAPEPPVTNPPQEGAR